MQKTSKCVIACLALVCFSFSAGYVSSCVRKDNKSGGSGSSSDNQISQLVELTREYLVRERAELAAERSLINQQRDLLTADRAELERERNLFNRQRELVVSDRADLAELTNIFEQIKVLAQGQE